MDELEWQIQLKQKILDGSLWIHGWDEALQRPDQIVIIDHNTIEKKQPSKGEQRINITIPTPFAKDTKNKGGFVDYYLIFKSGAWKLAVVEVKKNASDKDGIWQSLGYYAGIYLSDLTKERIWREIKDILPISMKEYYAIFEHANVLSVLVSFVYNFNIDYVFSFLRSMHKIPLYYVFGSGPHGESFFSTDQLTDANVENMSLQTLNHQDLANYQLDLGYQLYLKLQKLEGIDVTPHHESVFSVLPIFWKCPEYQLPGQLQIILRRRGKGVTTRLGIYNKTNTIPVKFEQLKETFQHMRGFKTEMYSKGKYYEFYPNVGDEPKKIWFDHDVNIDKIFEYLIGEIGRLRTELSQLDFSTF